MNRESDALRNARGVMERMGITDDLRGITGHTRFFEPDTEMIQWLVDYADGRMIVDVGCGSGHILEKIHDDAGYAKACGIEPYWDPMKVHERMGKGKNMIQVMPQSVESCNIFRPIENVLFICCRPCHSGFHGNIEMAAHPNAEILYIGLRRNFATDGVEGLPIIPHKGTSVEDEVVLQLRARTISEEYEDTIEQGEG